VKGSSRQYMDGSCDGAGIGVEASGLLLDCFSLMEAACSGQDPEHMWPLKNEYGSVVFSYEELVA